VKLVSQVKWWLRGAKIMRGSGIIQAETELAFRTARLHGDIGYQDYPGVILDFGPLMKDILIVTEVECLLVRSKLPYKPSGSS